AREHVAAEVVDTERMRAARPGRRAERVERARVLVVGPGQPERLDDQRREDRHQDQPDDEREGDHRHAVRAEAAPEELERGERGDVTAAATGLDDVDLFGRFEGCDAHRGPDPVAWSTSIMWGPARRRETWDDALGGGAHCSP